jgi:hypothetical protein
MRGDEQAVSISMRKNIRDRVIPRTKAACGETVEKSIAPVALPIWTDRTIQGVPIAACGHRGSDLQKTRICSNVVECYPSGYKVGGHVHTWGWVLAIAVVMSAMLTWEYCMSD